MDITSELIGAVEDILQTACQKPSEPTTEAPERGDRVRVVKGRKVAHGTEGELFWMKEQNYDGNTVIRIGIRDDQGEVHWTYMKNVVRLAA